MNCPHCTASSLSADGLEQIAGCSHCQGDWIVDQTQGIVERGNLIYLPFASHLADEDEAEWAKAA